MKKLLLLILAVFITIPCLASTDNACLNKCLDNGYSYNYCTSQCSYNPYNISSPPKRTDYMCMNKCINNGYLQQYCKEVCSY